MSTKLAILPKVRIIKNLTPLQKRLASELIRKTIKQEWLTNSLETLAKNLECKETSLKNALSYLKKEGWLESERKLNDQKTFKYKATQAFFDFVENYKREADKTPFATFNKKN